jgi:hypothetical protein
MIHFEALATISGVYSDTFRGVVSHMSEIENAIEKQARKRGDVFTIEIQEMITATSAEALYEKEL